jgi:hypothetical protein
MRPPFPVQIELLAKSQNVRPTGTANCRTKHMGWNGKTHGVLNKEATIRVPRFPEKETDHISFLVSSLT